MASSAVQPAPLHAPARFMLGADRIICAERTHPQGMSEVLFDVASLLHQPPEGPVSVGAPRIEKHPEALPKTVGIDALPDGARGITAAHGKRLNQKVRECVQQHVGSTRKRSVELAVLDPNLMPGCESIEPLLYGRLLEPTPHSLRP